MGGCGVEMYVLVSSCRGGSAVGSCSVELLVGWQWAGWHCIVAHIEVSLAALSITILFGT